jgi:phosphopantothenoylcysteine synthetase/decarboxylase
MCAAVTDYKPRQVSKTKIKKRDANLSLELVPTRDILASHSKQDRQFVVVGFAAETEKVEANARKKLQEKNCDIVVANDVSRADSGMESDENEVIILFRDGEKKTISRAPKTNVARELIKIFENVCEKRLTKKNA